MKVTILGAGSQLKEMLSGVPLESVFGSILFMLMNCQNRSKVTLKCLQTT